MTHSSSHDITDLVHRGQQKIRTQLPAMNAAIDRAGSDPAALVEAWTPWVSEAAAVAVGDLDAVTRGDARRLVQILDFPVGSIERHAQRAGELAGVAKSALRDIDVTLLAFARRGELPAPRGGVSTYWLENNEHDPLLFTGEDGEARFTRAVIGIERRQAAGYALLRDICVGDVDVTSPEGVERLAAAAENAAGVREVFLDLWRKGADGTRNLTVEVFTCKLRTYLTAYPVGGVHYGGPNAANIPGQIQHDLAVGTLQPFYREQLVAERLVHLDADACARVIGALAHPSVLARLLDALGLTALEVTSYSTDMLAARLADRAGACAALRGFIALARACGSTWGTHQSQINTYLKKAAREVPAERLRDLPVPPSTGTGGHSHDQTERLMRMRHNHPVVDALRDAIQRVELSTGSATP